MLDHSQVDTEIYPYIPLQEPSITITLGERCSELRCFGRLYTDQKLFLPNLLKNAHPNDIKEEWIRNLRGLMIISDYGARWDFTSFCFNYINAECGLDESIRRVTSPSIITAQTAGATIHLNVNLWA